MQLTSDQLRAVDKIDAWLPDPMRQMFYLTGVAGTGKSTLIKRALSSWSGLHIEYGAYTAKAALVMRNKGCPDATTIHRLLYKSFVMLDPATGQPLLVKGKKQYVTRLDRNGPAASADLVVLDECSMISPKMFDDLLRVVKKVLFIGDPGQLPPVKAKSVFEGLPCDCQLTEIHRQALNNPILRYAADARAGRLIPIGDHGAARKMTREKWVEQWDYSEDQIIVGFNKTRNVINKVAREHYGYGTLPGDGAKIICKENNPKYGVLNGEIYRVVGDITIVDAHSIIADIDNGIEITKDVVISTDLFTSIPKAALNDAPSFDWGFAITGHASQGSEWDDVVVLDDGFGIGPYCEAGTRARWLYTCATRSAKKLTIVRW